MGNRQRSFRRSLRAVFLFAVVPYLAVTLLFTLAQRKLLYRPTVAKELLASDYLPPSVEAQDVRIDTEDGQRLHGWYIHATEQQNNTSTEPAETEPMLVLYFPGNSLNRAARVDDLLEIVNFGYDVLTFDYRGFGDSTGKPTQAALTDDARAIYDFATNELTFDSSEVIIFGESLGGAVAVSHWNTHWKDHRSMPAGFILNSTFASMSDVVGHHYPLFPFRFFLKDDWRPIENFASLQQRPPVVTFHGTNDEMIPISQARKLANALRSAELVEISGGFHNEIPTGQLKAALIKLRERSRDRRQTKRGIAKPLPD